jgi:hypothetical protein
VHYKAFRNPFPTPDTSIPPEFSLNPPPSLQLGKVYDELRAFVTDKEARGLPSGVRLYAYAVANEGAALRTGISVQGRLKTQKVYWLAVAGLWPVHWVLLLNGDDLDQDLVDLTEWANFGFKSKKSLTVQMPCQWSVGKYPLDFRSPDEFKKAHFVGMMRFEGFIPGTAPDNERTFNDAISFARRRGRWTREGYLMTEFRSGTYYEAYGRYGWLEGFDLANARKTVKEQLSQDQ